MEHIRIHASAGRPVKVAHWSGLAHLQVPLNLREPGSDPIFLILTRPERLRLIVDC
jgi:hypothetical protein